jgi:hypothetical protein
MNRTGMAILDNPFAVTSGIVERHENSACDATRPLAMPDVDVTDSAAQSDRRESTPPAQRPWMSRPREAVTCRPERSIRHRLCVIPIRSIELLGAETP